MRKHAIVLLMALVIVIQGVLVTGIVQPKAGSLTQNVPQHENVYQSAGLPGEKPLLANVLPNPGFEQVDSYGGPLQWNYYGSAYTRSNASYTGLTYGGSYSGLLEVMGTQQWGTDAYMYRYLTSAPFAMLSQRIILNLFWDVRQNPDIARWAYAYIRLEIYDGSSWFYIYYALSFGNNVGSNSTHSSWIRLNNTLDAWHQLNRNVTSDFEKCFLMPVPTNMMLYDMFFYAVSPQQATGKITMVIDEVSLKNSTLYEYLLDSNGNFEMGNGANWNTESSYDPARVALTAEHTEGNCAVNMSCSASGSGLNGYASLYQYSSRGFFTEPDGLVVQFDYMYKDAQGGGTGQYAYVYVSYSNRSISGNVFWYLGRGSDLFDDVNSTYYCYTRADGFGSRGVWHHVTADVGSLLKQNHITNVAVQYLTFYVNAGSSANSSVQLLVDRVSVVTDPLGDPGFEQDTNLYFGPVPSWDIWSGGAPYVSQTASARTGKWAANLTAYGGTSAGIYRSMWLEMDSSVFTDFYWKLDSSPYASSTNVMVRLSFQGGYEVDYVLANVGGSYSNSSWQATYYASGLNQTGVWNRLYRNLTLDLTSVFGTPVSSWNLTQCVLYAYGGSSGGKISVLFDDMNFLDKQGPTIRQVLRDPVVPMYHDVVKVTVNATDNLAGVGQVWLYYRQGAGPYTVASAVKSGGLYQAFIPPEPYGTPVFYYVNATDNCGSITTTSSVWYSPGDDVAPYVEILSPEQNDVLTGTVVINASAYDAGSGVAFVLFRVDGNLIANISAGPYQYAWNSRLVTNSMHTILATAYDVAGLPSSTSVGISTANDYSPPMVSAVHLNPAVPQYGQTVVIYVAVTDQSGVHSVVLHHRTDSGLWTATPMTASGALYEAILASDVYGTRVEYYVVAMDVYNASVSISSQSSPLFYIVGDTTNPTISVSGPSTGTPLKDTVWFGVSANDGIGGASGLGRFLFFVDGILTGNSSTVPSNFTWATTSVSNGYHTLTFRVVDRAGNPASVNLTYYVANGVIDFGPVMSSYGFFIGAGGTIAVIIVVSILLKRRAAK